MSEASLYERYMLTTHRGMNINETEYLAVLDDIMSALGHNGVGRAGETGGPDDLLFAQERDRARVNRGAGADRAVRRRHPPLRMRRHRSVTR